MKPEDMSNQELLQLDSEAFLASLDSVTHSRYETPVTHARPCNGCGKEFTNRGDVCNACRQKAYRERRSD